MDPDRDTLDPSSEMEAKTAPVFRQALFFSKKQNESFVQLALLTHLGEALAAIDRTVGLGLKGNLGLAAAGSANSGEVLAGTAGSVLASVTAGLARRRVLQPLKHQGSMCMRAVWSMETQWCIYRPQELCALLQDHLLS